MAWYGEQPCAAVRKTGNPCRFRAYWTTEEGLLLCGTHAKKQVTMALLKNPEAGALKSAEYSRHKQTTVTAAEENQRHGLPGKLGCAKQKMMKAFEHVDGYITVYPTTSQEERRESSSDLTASVPQRSHPSRWGRCGTGRPACPTQRP